MGGRRVDDHSTAGTLASDPGEKKTRVTDDGPTPADAGGIIHGAAVLVDGSDSADPSVSIVTIVEAIEGSLVAIPSDDHVGLIP